MSIPERPSRKTSRRSSTRTSLCICWDPNLNSWCEINSLGCQRGGTGGLWKEAQQKISLFCTKRESTGRWSQRGRAVRSWKETQPKWASLTGIKIHSLLAMKLGRLSKKTLKICLTRIANTNLLEKYKKIDQTITRSHWGSQLCWGGWMWWWRPNPWKTFVKILMECCGLRWWCLSQSLETLMWHQDRLVMWCWCISQLHVMLVSGDLLLLKQATDNNSRMLWILLTNLVKISRVGWKRSRYWKPKSDFLCFTCRGSSGQQPRRRPVFANLRKNRFGVLSFYVIFLATCVGRYQQVLISRILKRWKRLTFGCLICR